MPLRPSRLLLVLVLALSVVPLSISADELNEEEPPTARWYMRNGGDGCPGSPFLHPDPGSGEPGCGYVGGSPFGELHHVGAWSSTIKTYSGSAGLPQELDAGREITGNVRVVSSSTTNRMAAGQIRVDVTVRARISTGTVTLGTSSNEQLINPTNSAEIDVPFAIEVDTARDGETITQLHVDVDIRGWHVFSGYHRLNGQSWLDLPVHLADEAEEV